MSTNNVTLVWQDTNLIEKGHKIYRSDAPMDVNNMPTALATLGTNTTSYIDQGLTVGDIWYYRVSAFIDGHEMFSEEIQVTVREGTEIFLSKGLEIIVNNITFNGEVYRSRRKTFTEYTNFIIPDDKNNAFVAHGSAISMVDTNNNIIWSYTDHSDTVNDLSLSSNGILLSGSSDNTTRLINMSVGTIINSHTHNNPISAVSISDFNIYIFFADFNGNITSLDNQLNVLWSTKLHNNKVSSILANDVGYVLTSSLDGYIRKIDSSDGSIIWSYRNSGAGGFNDVAESTNNTVYAVGNDGYLYSITDGSLNWSKLSHNGNALSVDCDKSNLIYTVGEDGKIVLTDSDSNTLWEYAEYSETIKSVKVSTNYIPPVAVDVEGTVYTLKTPNNTDEQNIEYNVAVYTLKDNITIQP